MVFSSSDEVASVAFSPCGKWIASCSDDKTVRIWNAATGAPVGSPLTVDAGEYGVQSVSFSPKDNLIAAGCYNGKIHLVDAVAGEVKSSLRGHSKDNPECACTFDYFGNLEQSNPECPVTGHRYVPFPCIECFLSYFGTDLVFLTSHCVTSVVYSPCGKWITSGSFDETVRIWDAASGAPVGSPLRGHRYDPFPCIECLLS